MLSISFVRVFSKLHQEEGCLVTYLLGACVINSPLEELPDLLGGQRTSVGHLERLAVLFLLSVLSVNKEDKFTGTLILSEVAKIQQSALGKELELGQANRYEETPFVDIEYAWEFGDDVSTEQSALRRDHKRVVSDVKRLSAQS